MEIWGEDNHKINSSWSVGFPRLPSGGEVEPITSLERPLDVFPQEDEIVALLQPELFGPRFCRDRTRRGCPEPPQTVAVVAVVSIVYGMA